jgi:hypothetical protein
MGCCIKPLGQKADLAGAGISAEICCSALAARTLIVKRMMVSETVVETVVVSGKPAKQGDTEQT